MPFDNRVDCLRISSRRADRGKLGTPLKPIPLLRLAVSPPGAPPLTRSDGLDQGLGATAGHVLHEAETPTDRRSSAREG